MTRSPEWSEPADEWVAAERRSRYPAPSAADEVLSPALRRSLDLSLGRGPGSDGG